jgi:hypothetical protein
MSDEFGKPIKWHHPIYNPHITIAFVKPGVAAGFIGTSLLEPGSNSEAFASAMPFTGMITVNGVQLNAYQNKTFVLVAMALWVPESLCEAYYKVESSEESMYPTRVGRHVRYIVG